MDVLCSYFHGLGAGITFRHHGVHAGQHWAGLPSGFEADYGAHFHALDPWANASDAFGAGAVGTSDDLLSRSHLVESAFYQDLCRPHGIRDFSGVLLFRDSGYMASFGIMHSKQVHDASALRGLLGPLVLVAKNELRRRRHALAEGVADALPFGVFLVDVERGVVLVANPAGARLEERGVVCRVRGRLSVDDHEVTPLLRSEKLPRQLVTPRRAVRVVVHSAIATFSKKTCIVHVHDRRAIAHERTNRAVQLYGLTPREADVAEALVLGHSPAAIARQHKDTMPTLRTQIRSILAKTGADRLTSLLLLLRET